MTAALSPDKKILAGGIANSIIIWDLARGAVLRRFGEGPGQQDLCLAFSPDGKALASGATENSIHLFEVATGREIRRFTGPRAGVACLAFAGNGKLLAARALDGKVYLWDTASGKHRHSQDGNPGNQADLTVSPDGNLVALGKGRAVVILEAASGKQLHRFGGHAGTVQTLALSPDGRTLASAAGTTVHLWDIQKGKERRRIDNVYAGRLAFSPDGKTLATTGAGNQVRLWDTGTGKELLGRPGPEGQVCSVRFSPDGRFLATADAGDSRPAAVRFWDTASGNEVHVCRGQGFESRCLLFAPDGKTLLASELFDSVREWNVAAGKQRRQFRVGPSASRYENQLYAAALSPEGTSLTALSRSRSNLKQPWTLVVWNLSTGERRATRQTWGNNASVPILSPDGKLVAVGEGHCLHIRQAATEADCLVLDNKSTAVWPVAFTSDSRLVAGVRAAHLADGRTKETLCVWEVATGQEMYQMKLPERVYSFAFSPDGRVLASAGDAAAGILLLDMATGKELLRLGGHRADVLCLAFSPDGTRLATGLRNTTALVWRIPPVRGRARQRAHALGGGELEGLWDDLADRRAPKANAALWRLVASPGQAVALFRDHIHPARRASPKRIARLIANLGNDRYKVRAAATRELEEVLGQAETQIRHALAAEASPETRLRLKRLLAGLGPVRSPEGGRRIRAIQVLEMIGTKEARQVLERLAMGAPGARRTKEAKASLERLVNGSAANR
jgi:WD40 repeat protein